MIAHLEEATLRQWVADGLTDEQIAARVEVKPYLVTAARRAAGIKRPPGRQGQERKSFLLRLPEGRSLEDLRRVAKAAKQEVTGDWLAALAFEAPELARVVRAEGTRKAAGKAALTELLTLLLGPEDRAVEPTSSE